MATHQKKHNKQTGITKELIMKDDSQEYAEVVAAKGDNRFEVKLISNGFSVIAKLRGALTKGRNKQRIEKGNVVLCQMDMTSSDYKFYIMHKYTKDHIKNLKKNGDLASYVEKDDENNVIFDDDVESKQLETAEIDDNFIAGI
jgi:initiation factor 1A